MILLLAIIIILIGICSIYLSLKFCSNILSPLTAFLIPYILAMLMYLLNFNNYFSVEPNSFFIIIGVLVLFTVTQILVLSRIRIKKKEEEFGYDTINKKYNRLIRFMALIIFIGLISTFIQVFLLSSRTGISIINLYSKMPGFVEDNVRIEGFSQISLLAIPSSAVLFACLLRLKNAKKQKLWYLLIIIQVISTLYANQKGLTIINIIWLIFIYFLESSSSKKKLLIGIISAISVVGVFVITYGFYNLAVAGIFLSGHVNPFDRLIRYFSGGIGGLVYVINNNVRYDESLINLYPIRKMIDFSTPAPYEAFYNVGNMTTNISGLLGTFYIDFGFMGLLLVVMLLFFISFFMVKVYMERGGLFSLLVYSYYLTHLSLAFFGNFSVYTFNMYIILFLIMINVVNRIKLRRN